MLAKLDCFKETLMKTLLLVLAVTLAVILAGCGPQQVIPGAPGAGAPGGSGAAAGFVIPSLADSSDISLAVYQGRVVLLDFWATWCPPCRSELPALDGLYRGANNRGFTIIGMTVDQGSREEVSAAVKRFNLSYPVGLAGPDVQASYGGIRAVPTKFLLDKKGNVYKRYLGVVPEGELRADIETLLAM
jgi:thiol-disulfide isomerase/thioredoxin